MDRVMHKGALHAEGWRVLLHKTHNQGKPVGNVEAGGSRPNSKELGCHLMVQLHHLRVCCMENVSFFKNCKSIALYRIGESCQEPNPSSVGIQTNLDPELLNAKPQN